ncbi:Uncharacterised protein [Escherichia coli]|nr:Uncharacterised protein [Escherichia coli]CAD5882522.1 Uncharacterised protein [Escherichia coli]
MISLPAGSRIWLVAGITNMLSSVTYGAANGGWWIWIWRSSLTGWITDS